MDKHVIISNLVLLWEFKELQASLNVIQADCVKSFVEVGAEDNEWLVVVVGMKDGVDYGSCGLHAAFTFCETILFWVLGQLQDTSHPAGKLS